MVRCAVQVPRAARHQDCRGGHRGLSLGRLQAAVRGVRDRKVPARRLERQAKDVGPRQPSYAERMSNLSNNLGQEYANFDILHMMKTDIEAGKSFTESMKSFGGMTYDDTHFGDMEDNEITRLGPRAAYGTPHVDHWERMGGRFSAQEQEHLNNTPEQTPPEPPSPEEREILGRPIHEVEPEEVDRFTSQSHEEREETLKGMHRAVSEF